MLKAILFDMDGVIVDTEPLHRKAYFAMFEEVGITVSETMYNGFTGRSTITICRKLVSHFGLERSAEELVMIKRKHFKHLFNTDTSLELLEGVLALIQNYKANGLTLILASSASMPNIERIFERFDLDRYFSGKLSGADLRESKPHPEIFLKAAEAAGESVENCIVIEDSSNGIKAAKDAGIYCVGYKSVHSKDQDYELADLVITNFGEITYDKVAPLFE